jgi:hypothetical protein
MSRNDEKVNCSALITQVDWLSVILVDMLSEGIAEKSAEPQATSKN